MTIGLHFLGSESMAPCCPGAVIEVDGPHSGTGTCKTCGGDVLIGSRVRTFDTGATRDTDAGKLDYDGFLSPLVLKRYAEYMDENRTLKDGSVRDGGNWKQGIPKDAYAKSEWRHHMEFWSLHHGYGDGDIERAICACIFNLSGYLHELLKDGERQAYPPAPYPDEDFA